MLVSVLGRLHPQVLLVDAVHVAVVQEEDRVEGRVEEGGHGEAWGQPGIIHMYVYVCMYIYIYIYIYTYVGIHIPYTIIILYSIGKPIETCTESCGDSALCERVLRFDAWR